MRIFNSNQVSFSKSSEFDAELAASGTMAVIDPSDAVRISLNQRDSLRGHLHNVAAEETYSADGRRILRYRFVVPIDFSTEQYWPRAAR